MKIVQCTFGMNTFHETNNKIQKRKSRQENKKQSKYNLITSPNHQ